LFGVVFGKFTSQLIKGIAELGWKPEDVLPTSAASIVPRAGGLENAVGMISSSNQKDVNDVQWANDQA
jgi:branched-chain amino acid transport system substrate-binding protein